MSRGGQEHRVEHFEYLGSEEAPGPSGPVRQCSNSCGMSFLGRMPCTRDDDGVCGFKVWSSLGPFGIRRISVVSHPLHGFVDRSLRKLEELFPQTRRCSFAYSSYLASRLPGSGCVCVCVIQGAWRLSLPSETKLYVTFVGTNLRRCGAKETRETQKPKDKVVPSRAGCVASLDG